MAVVSIATRTTSLRDRQEWETRLGRVLPRIEAILRGQPGFVSAEFRWGVHDDGSISNITTWETNEDAVRYVRGGAAATIDWLDQLAVPPNPDYRNAPRRFTYADGVVVSR
jgi:hypothetical protein